MKSIKPSPWNLIDFLSFGLFALFPTIVTIIVFASGPIVTMAGQIVTLPAGALFIAICLASWAIYFSLVYTRYKKYKPFTIETKHKLLVNTNGYNITKEQLEEAVEVIILRYEAVGINARKYITKEITWVVFDPNLIEDDSYGKDKKLWGFTKVGGNFIDVSFAKSVKEDVPDPNKPLDKTAFEHELGHVVLGHYLGNWNASEHHKFMKEHGLR